MNLILTKIVLMLIRNGSKRIISANGCFGLLELISDTYVSDSVTARTLAPNKKNCPILLSVFCSTQGFY